MFEAIPLHLLLAMTCVAEVGFHQETTECELMWEINYRNSVSRNRSLRKQTLLFNSYWKSTEQRGRRPWIQHLNGTEEPLGWPQTIRWGVHKRMWLKYVRAARAFLATKKKRPQICPGAVDYGAPEEYPRKHFMMKRVYCVAGTLQWYWVMKSKREQQERKGILGKNALANKSIISESILTQKRRSEKNNGVSD